MGHVLHTVAAVPRRSGLLGALLIATLAAAGCKSFDRSACACDSDCTVIGEICYFDGYCLRRDVADRAGDRPVGDECTVSSQCPPPAWCQTGYCVGEADAAPPPDAYWDVKPPVFAGLAGIHPDGEGDLLVYWSPLALSDDVTILPLIEVRIYRGPAGGMVDLTTPIGMVKGEYVFRDTGLAVGSSWTYVARARDEAGNEDTNTVAVTATVEAWPTVAPGVDFTTQVLPIFQANCVACHGGTAGLRLDSYSNVIMGGASGAVVVPCMPELSNIVLKPSPTPPFGARMPFSGPPYLPMLSRAIIERWVADGGDLAYNPTKCGDVVAPVFAGLATLSATSATECLASWTAASDDVSTSDKIRYRIYVATASGAQDFGLPRATTPAGSTVHNLTGLVSGVPVYVVVRAMDEAGNEDDNTVERTCTPM